MKPFTFYDSMHIRDKAEHDLKKNRRFGYMGDHGILCKDLN